MFKFIDRIFLASNSAHDVLYSPVPLWECEGRKGEMNAPVPLQFVQVVIQSWNSFLETLTLACISHDLSRLGAGFHGISRKDLPVIKHTLWEGLTRCVGTKVSSEAFGEKNKELCPTFNKSKRES